MSESIRITTPLTPQKMASLQCGDSLLLSGTIYSARDAAHKRLVELLERGEPLPLDLEGQTIYYVGPSPAPPGRVIGSAGPTTSYRMDSYAPLLLAHGLRGMIGKGQRSAAVRASMQEHGALYFAAVGGAGALLARSIKKLEIVAWEDLGPEALCRMEVEDMPLIVINDLSGRDLYDEGCRRYMLL